jgi:hypothetical protein
MKQNTFRLTGGEPVKGLYYCEGTFFSASQSIHPVIGTVNRLYECGFRPRQAGSIRWLLLPQGLLGCQPGDAKTKTPS